MNELAPLTQNQVNYYMRCFDSWFNVAEGGKRGGKNVIQTLIFCTMLEIHPNKLHLVAGVSQATAKLNILDCDGLGLTNFFEGRCRDGKYKDRACLFVQTKTGEKIVLVSGGAKANDFKYIKGNTYGMAYITEVNECHPDFIKEVFDRTLSSADRKVFHDLNPKASRHWYYTDVLDFHEKKQSKNKNYGYNYGHFTIADNLSIDDEKLKSTLATYQKGTVWYDRDILGLRKTAEGLVYDFGEDNITDDIPKNGEYYISVDYGTLNPFSAGLWCVLGDKAVRVKEYYYSGRNTNKQMTDEEYCNEIEKLAEGHNIRQIIIDPSAASFITAIHKRGFATRKANNDVLDGIRRTAVYLKNGNIKIHRSCADSIAEFGLYRWDEKATEDRVIKENDHAMDEIRYFCNTIMKFKVGKSTDGIFI